MYKLIFKFAINNNIYNKSVFYDKILRKIGLDVTKKQFYVFRTAVSFLSNLFVAVAVISLLKVFWGFHKTGFIFFVFYATKGVFEGLVDYKEIFIPSFEKWYNLAPTNDKKLFFTLISAKLTNNFIFSSDILIVPVCSLILYPFVPSVLLTLVIIVSYLSFFIVTAKITSSVEYRELSDINIFYFFKYILLSSTSLFLGLKGGEFFYFVFKKKISLFRAITENLVEIFNVLEKNFLVVCFFSLIFLNLILVFVFFAKDVFIVKNKNKNLPEKGLVFNYIKFIFRNRKNYLEEHLVKMLYLNFKYLVPKFFEIFLINFSTFFYLGVTFSLMFLVKAEFLRIQILIAFTLICILDSFLAPSAVLASYFVLTNNKNELYFLKVYFNNVSILEYKKRLLRKIALVPSSIILLIDFSLIVHFNMKILFFVPIIFTGLVGFFLSSKIYTCLLNSSVNFKKLKENTESDSLDFVLKTQKSARIVLILMPCVVTFLFCEKCKNLQNLGVYLELFLIFLSGMAINKICANVEKKGLKSLYEKIN
ncbi:MAG: hypothetical protein LBF33_02545 [Oscillospiraceae bacterium]|jgi:hypothetical protein|nr:hypothetical protein [Oscillospiraceae bacterium]